MVKPTTRDLIGFATVKKQFNDQIALEISVDVEKLKVIKTHEIEGKPYLGFSINAVILKKVLEGEREYVHVHYCEDHKTNDKSPPPY